MHVCVCVLVNCQLEGCASNSNMLLRFSSPRDLVKRQILIQGPRFCIFSKFPSDANASGRWTTLGAARGWRGCAFFVMCVSCAPPSYRESTSQANTPLFCSCAMVISPRLSYAYMSWGDSPLESNSTSQGFLDTRPSPRRGHQCQGSSGTGPSAALMPGTTKFWNHPFPVSPKQQSWAKAIFWGPPILGIRDMLRFIRKGIITMALHHL